MNFRPPNPDISFVDEVLNVDVRNIGEVSSLTISKYVIALSQYLVYFKYNVNQIQANLTRHTRQLEASIIQLITPEVIKKYKTKKEARVNLIEDTDSLKLLDSAINGFYDEYYLLEGVDKTISELIAAFKRELTRRENELYQCKHS
jgi:hypothetical protein